jgi:hypothetical protein
MIYIFILFIVLSVNFNCDLTPLTFSEIFHDEQNVEFSFQNVIKSPFFDFFFNIFFNRNLYTIA